MDKHIFSRWQTALCTLFVLADGLYLSGIGWLSLLCGAVVSAALLFFLLKLPGKLLNAVCAVLALLLTLRSISRIFFFWQYEGTQAALAVVLLVLTAWLLSRRGADCLFMWSFPVMLTAGTLLLLSAAVTVPDWNFGYLEFPVPRALLRESARTVPAFLAVLLPAHLAGGAKAPARGLLLGGGLLALLSLRTLLLLGRTPYAYPVYAAAGLAAVGDFLKRCEVVFAAVLVLCECTRIAVCFSFVRTCGGQKRPAAPGRAVQQERARKAAGAP